MCGIFGVIEKQNSYKTINDFMDLGIMSESRGKEASGYFLENEKGIKVFKSPTKFTDKYSIKILKKERKNKLINFVIGHTRLKTDGDEAIEENNQPCSHDNYYLVHNGIITNHLDINSGTDFSMKELDSFALLNLITNDKSNNKIVSKFKNSIQKLKGEITVCLYSEVDNTFVLYTNTGSLYYILDEDNSLSHFASEKWILNKYLHKGKILCQLDPFTGLLVNKDGNLVQKFKVKTEAIESNYKNLKNISETLYAEEILIPHIKRCNKCILPTTVPFIEFDKDGVCNFCKNHKEIKLKKIENLEKLVRKEKVIIAGFSGGRDSSFGLHVAKNFYDGKIISVSYDWGMITELARRNQARITGKLGIEHVWASADIGVKRNNIKKNLYAWLEKPDLGMLPILMAGDKVWQDILHDIAKKNSADYILQFQSPYEVTQFKYGLANIAPIFNFQEDKFLNTTFNLKVKMFIYYVFGILKNRRYWNTSLIDSFKGFISFNFKKTKLVYPFEFIEFNEDEVDKILEENYQWEFDKYNPSSWRIGDGTAPFYNLIYWKFCGFTENDFFRSNQVREGKIERSVALKKTLFENQIKETRIQEYLSYINADYDYVMEKLNTAIKKNSLVDVWLTSNSENLSDTQQ